MRKEKAIPILESIVESIENTTTSTHNLLTRCLEAAELLNLPSREKNWITQELTGYEDQNETSRRELPPFKHAPHYRWLELPARISYIRPKKTVHITGLFAVCFPCKYLESVTSDIELQTTHVIKPENIRDRLIRGTIVANANAKLPVNRIKPIIHSIRGFVYRFAITLLISLQFGKSISGIIDNTRNLVASRLRIISGSLLGFLNETLDSYKKNVDELHWRVALENIRTVLRRFTGLLLKDDMKIEIKPKEGETKKKVDFILQWCGGQLKGKKGTELESLNKEIKILLDIINKPIHSEITEVSKNEVERILLKSLIWMAGMIDILDHSEYSWVPEKITPKTEL